MTQKIAVVGLGYIGLPTAAAIAAQGVPVVGVDVNETAVNAVNEGRIHIVEPDLDAVVAKAVADGLLTATTEMPAADVYMIAVPTPFLADRSADLSYVERASKSVAAALSGGELVILESTSPPGTTELMAQWVHEARPDLEPGSVLFAHCPERVLPGQVLRELRENDRIIGGLTPEATEKAAAVYRIFCVGELLPTDAKTAEFVKLVENSFRDVNIAFANELSLISDRLGIDVWHAIELANHHPRVNILTPGPGVGGHCIAVDPWFIVAAAPEESRLIKTAREVNDHKPEWVLERAQALLAEKPGATAALLGLAFKKNIDDLRESPALEIAHELATRSADRQFVVVEPNVHEIPKALAGLGNVSLAGLDDALAQADVVVLLVDHDEFAAVTSETLVGKAVLDTRGQWRDR